MAEDHEVRTQLCLVAWRMRIPRLDVSTEYWGGQATAGLARRPPEQLCEVQTDPVGPLRTGLFEPKHRVYPLGKRPRTGELYHKPGNKEDLYDRKFGVRGSGFGVPDPRPEVGAGWGTPNPEPRTGPSAGAGW